jgi:P27 family predicted phage terminase small subunit
MAKRGPKPKLGAAKAAPKGIPRPPAGLEPAAKKHWVDVARLVNEAGYGAACDVEAMSFYIATWARWRKAEYKLGEPPAIEPGKDGGGEVIVTVNKYLQLNPWYVIARESLKELKSYLAEFGLSPKARAKLIAPEPEEEQGKWEGFD